MNLEPTASTPAVTGAIPRPRGRPARTSNISGDRAGRVEFQPEHKRTTSSAKGLFQFIEQTWLATLKEAGGALGYRRMPMDWRHLRAVRVTDPKKDDRVLNLRADPNANALMAGAYTRNNAEARRTARP